MALWLEPQLDGGPLACNANGTIVHLYDATRDKGTALLALVAHFGLRAEETLTFGDNFNDGPMLDGRHGFLPATVANAEETVKGWVRDAGGRGREAQQWHRGRRDPRDGRSDPVNGTAS